MHSVVLYCVSVKNASDVKAEVAEKMETNKASGKVNPKTLKNEHGNYPVWMNQRQVRKKKKELKHKQKKTANKKKK